MFTEVKRGVAPECNAELRNNCKNCALCYSPAGCCGSKDKTICDESLGQCCDACLACNGCEACFPHDTCNPVPTGGEVEAFDAGCNTAYDFDLQELVPFAKPFKLYKTDVLVAHCIYNSMERTKFTPGGDETDNEMCINFLMYYPKTEGADYQCLLGHSSGKKKSYNVSPNFDHVCKIPGEYNASLYAKLKDSLANCTRNTGGGGGSGADASSSWIVSHAICMLACWAVLIPIGVALAMRREKTGEKWFKMHKFLNCAGLLLGIIGVIIALSNYGEPLATRHGRLGVAVMTLGLLQPINAFFRPHKVTDGKAVDSKRKMWEFWHKNSGRLTMLVALVNIFYGGHEANELYLKPGLKTLAIGGIAVALIIILGASAELMLAGINGEPKAVKLRQREEREMNGVELGTASAPKHERI